MTVSLQINIEEERVNIMDDAGPTASIILFFVLMIVDMMFFAFGSAIRTVSDKEIERKANEENDPKAKKLLSMMDDPEKYVNTVQLVVTVVNLVMGAFFLTIWEEKVHTFLIMHFGEAVLESWTFDVFKIAGVVATAFAMIYLILTVGILWPKKIAAHKPEQVAYFLLTPVRFFMFLFTPLTGLVSVTVKGLMRLFHLRDKGEESDVTEEEIIDIVNEGHEQGVLEASEVEMINNIIEFGDKEAKDIMTHTRNIVAIENTMSFREAMQFMMDQSNSRFPVFEENLDHIIGILYVKDAMKMQWQGVDMDQPVTEIEGLLREAQFIPETSNINTMFERMQMEKVQMMLVVDEYGQTLGLVTMEDILEEIVGNILDEYDEDEEHIEEKGEDVYVIDGLTPLDELTQRFGFDFEGSDFETLNGFMISKLDKIPEADEEFEMDFQGYHLKILSVEKRMIASVEVTKLFESDEESNLLIEEDQQREENR